MSDTAPNWRRLCGLAVELVGGQDQFRKESNILKRIVKQFGAGDVERMMAGAKLMRWSSLTSLGSADGLGRRMALQAWWQSQNRHPAKLPESIKSILREMSR